MKIRIDAEKCQGHNRCFALAPELVDVDDYGAAFVLNDGIVPDDLADKAQLIIDNCPEFAIEEVAE
ncbi:MAG: ferredoxin [Acidimicrobiales bacterium]|nr:ferredoxin [Acidimicrobiales bacterium]RZV46792.1 MAG: ferredoxin [Acidimicrobiales bacterium]